MFSPLRVAPRLPLRAVRWNSTAAPEVPPLMAKMRADLKTAMREKNTVRLGVLRGLISDYNSSTKTPKPITTDMGLLSLIQKRLTGAQDAAQEFSAANRPDLKEKEDMQALILGEYAGEVKTLDRTEIKEIVVQEVTKMAEAREKVLLGTVIKKVLGANGPLDNKARPSDAVEVIKEVLADQK